MTKQCKACGKAFQPHPKVPNQTYCSSPECQRERRRRWLEEKRQVDADYQGNEPQKIEQWRNEHPDCKTACKTFQISGVISVQKLPPWVV